MPENNTITGDLALRTLREYVAAVIAGIIVLGTSVLIGLALQFADDQERFSRAKELVQILVPVLTFVVGYYFNKVTTENRAESAEAVARGATAQAQQASEGRNLAQAEAASAKRAEEEAKRSLKEVGEAGERMAERRERGAATERELLGAEEGGAQALEQARHEFRLAWTRAKRLLN